MDFTFFFLRTFFENFFLKVSGLNVYIASYILSFDFIIFRSFFILMGDSRIFLSLEFYLSLDPGLESPALLGSLEPGLETP